MILERFPELLKLSDAERLQLCTELSGTLFTDERITDPGIIAVMERNMETYRRDPAQGKPWSDVRAKARAMAAEGPGE